MPQISKVDANPKAVHDEARTILLAGGVIAYPTDTFYGLAVDPFNQKAVDKLFKLKERERNKPLLLLIGSMSQLEALVKEITPYQSALIQKFWPGPLTLLFEPDACIPKNVTANSGRIGIRQPGNIMTRNLISALGQPVTGPSANFAGEQPPVTAEQVNQSMGKYLDLIIDGGTCPGGEPSTLVDATETPASLIRSGAIAFDNIESVLNDIAGSIQPEVHK